MLDGNIILGIPAALDCDNYSHAILTQNYDNLPCGTPVVYQAGSDLANRNHKIPIGVLISPTNGIPTERAMVPGVIVRPIDIKPLCGNHKVITVNHFDLAKFDRLRDFVRDVGVISIIVTDPGKETLIRNVQDLENKFRYTSMFYHNTWTKKFLAGGDDMYVCVLTFLDLPYCVPLFNMRKIDGMGLSISGATIKASQEYGQLHRIFRADFIYSNFEENVYVIDGVGVNSKMTPGSGTYRALNDYACTKLSVQNSPLKKKVDKNSWRGVKEFESKYLSGGVDSDGTQHVVFEAPSHQLYEVPNVSNITIDTVDPGHDHHMEISDQIFGNTTIDTQEPSSFNMENTASLTVGDNEEIEWSSDIFPEETLPEEEPDDEPSPFQNEEGN